jgi:hypothetical protein
MSGLGVDKIMRRAGHDVDLAPQARPLVDELVALIKWSRSPVATVIQIRRQKE